MKQETKEKIQYGVITVTAVASVLAIGITVVNNLFKPEFLNNLLREGKGEMILNAAAGIGLLVLTALVTGLAISNHKNKPENLKVKITALESYQTKLLNNYQTLEGTNKALTTEKTQLVTAIEGILASSPNAALSDVLEIQSNSIVVK